MTSLISKDILRKNAKEKRLLMAQSDAIKLSSSMITRKILSSKDFINAKNVALYYPLNSEVDISSLVNIKGKNYYFPRCKGLDMEFCLYSGADSLKKGSFGIMEPVLDAVDPNIFDIIYIPALMANNNCYRLGWGKGFYDRFFAKNKIKAKKVIVVLKEFISDEFKNDKFDYKCDEIISG